ncbi:mitotic spindle assembly checkpoint protein MAD2B [Manduca sexta]|uniref:HORMA domain-containing protein n=1 Tax=Manduca sexta TaxID=7130 RepID=A0A922CDL9_MANSE|nr:mitotic spindle assembly checkpoint protein MAD2B [Manduca sexta]KAG6441934.1 hypothetical protein O3G_MSEX002071 [Manduca sexta]
MDACFVDVTIEFLAVAFHSILYYTSVYPESIFETRRKYNVVVYRSIHPEVNQYIDLCLKTVAECLKAGRLTRIEFAITDANYKTIYKFIFDIEKNEHYEDTMDAYLIEIEQNLRAFCLKLPTLIERIRDLPEDCSFSIYIHTDESAAVSIACNADLEGFPMVEREEKQEECDQIIPLRRISIRSYNLDTYIEVS